MANRRVSVTSQSWGSRIGKTLAGAVGGLLAFILAFPLLWWNEGRAVQTAQSLEETEGNLTQIEVGSIDAANQHVPVYATGEAVTNEQLSDPQFGMAVNALRLQRSVQMYQWEETKTKEERKKIGGGTETVTTYDYKKIWSGSTISSSSFYDSSYQNPSSKRFEDDEWLASNATLGAFRLTDQLIRRIGDKSDLPVDVLPSGNTVSATFPVQAAAGEIYVGSSPDQPSIGDLRITYQYVAPQSISLVGRQNGNTFDPYPTEAGDNILLLESGTVPPELLFQNAHDANDMLTWVLRAVGFFMMLFGLFAVLKIFPVIGDVIPFVGSMIQAGVALLSGMVAILGSTFTIGLAWLFYRPLFGVPMLILSVGAVFGLLWLRKKGKAKAIAQDGTAAE